MESITWAETRRRLAQDRDRLRQYLDDQPGGRPLLIWFYPSYQCVFLYRLSHYLFCNGHKFLGRFFWHLNLTLTGADINPFSRLDGGLVIACPVGVTIVGKVGRNCTFETQSGIGGGRGSRDVGAGPGLPVLGDDVHLETGTMIAGPILVGSRSHLLARSVVLFDVPEDSEVEAPLSTVRPARESELVRPGQQAGKSS